MSDDHPALLALAQARGQIEYLEQDLSQAVHLFYVTLGWMLKIASPDQANRLRSLLHAKLFQLPQGSLIGKELIKLDEQSGGLLETHGVWLSRWVYEPREKHCEN